ncbi:MAG: LysM domain-containing protein [Desulfovermiculus sp.]|nr:LysM domain-containing protein [Desulfovermiculus sp.]
MFQAVCLVLLSLLMMLGDWVLFAHAAQPHGVFPKGTETHPPPDSFVYTVHKGDCLYSILKSLHIPRNKLETWVQRIMKQNPLLQNPDLIYPGDRIYLPPNLAPNNRDPRPDPDAQSKPKYMSKIPHTVNGPTPTSPPIQNRISQARPAHNKGYFSPNHPPTKPGEGNKDQAIKQLSHLGLDFSRQGEIIYPLGQGQWVRIHLDPMPLASTPWGDTILFAPQTRLSEPMFQDLVQAGLNVCPVPPSWTPHLVYTALEDACRSSFMVWSTSRYLILGLPGENSIEITAPTILAVKGGQKFTFAVFAPEPANSPNIPGLLLGYLKDHNIELQWSVPGAQESAWTPQSAPSRQDLWVPTRRWTDLGSWTKETKKDEPTDSKTHITSTLSYMPHKLLQKDTLRLSWTAADLTLILRVSLFSRRQNGRPTYFLPSDRADPYLVALLNLMGYSTYKLQF